MGPIGDQFAGHICNKSTTLSVQLVRNNLDVEFLRQLLRVLRPHSLPTTYRTYGHFIRFAYCVFPLALSPLWYLATTTRLIFETLMDGIFNYVTEIRSLITIIGRSIIIHNVNDFPPFDYVFAKCSLISPSSKVKLYAN